MDDDFEDVFKGEYEAFRNKVWRLERLAVKQGGFLKIIPTQPTNLKVYAAKMYRAVSRMSFVDMENVTPRPGEVCAFNAQQWACMPLWDVWETLRKCQGRLSLAVITGNARIEAGQVLVMNAVEVERITA